MPLTITIPGVELFDEEKNRFLTTESRTIEIEHSLVSLSKWEQKWKILFLGNKHLTAEQVIDYIRCMCLTPEVPEEAFRSIAYSPVVFKQVNDYIADTMTATWFSEHAPKKVSSEAVTSEVIYYWLVALTIPFETQYWHLNRLLTLIKVTNIKNDPKKKLMPLAELHRQQRDLNAERRAKYNSKG
jgi:hypothetical protein